MSQDRERLDALAHALESVVGADAVRRDEPMSAHTTFKVGGPADLFVSPASEDELVRVVRACRDTGVPHFLLGLGSDLLVGDGGYRGVMVDCAGALDDILMLGDPRERCQIVCEAGAAIADVSALAASLGLAGLEFACGIPGSVGGAVFMNAGAYDGCCADVLESVRCLMPSGFVEEIPAGELEMGYRTSRVRTETGDVIIAVMTTSPVDFPATAGVILPLLELHAELG